MSTTRRQFLKNLGGVALGAGAILWSDSVWAAQVTDRGNPWLLLDPQTLADSLYEGGRQILDIRDNDKYLSGHLQDAVQLWYPEVTVNVSGVPGLVAPPETVTAVMSEKGVDADTEVVVYGDALSIWAARMFWVLDYHGHTNVKLLDGGFPYWAETGFPLSLGRADAEPKMFVPDVQTQKRVDADWVLDHLDDSQVVFVDARSTSSYQEGHIPGAISKPWSENVDPISERFKSYETLLKRFEIDGITQERTVISYCQTGVLSAQNYFTFRRLGYPDVRLYDGSFADWSSQSDRPIEAGS